MPDVTIVSQVSRLETYFAGGRTRTLNFRLAQLDLLREALATHGQALLTALREDLGKSEAEAYTSEIAVVLHELAFVRKNLRKWMKPACAATPLHLQPGRSRIYSEPLGVVLIVGPWNYPVQLTLGPLIGALAAGNCVVIKPSELAPKTSAAIAALLNTFSADLVSVVEGGIEPTTQLLAQRFDHIFFTGSTTVGKIVYAAAAKHLTPVTLELGGKSPALVGASADLKLAARRLVWGKFMNAGQTCVAPDYIYADETIAAELLAEIKIALREQLGENPGQSPDYGKIVNARGFERLEKLMTSGKIAIGGVREQARLYIAPTVFTGITWQDPIMQEEIFGPLLPLLTFKKIDDALLEIRRRDKPLAAYLFSDSSTDQEKFLALSFGGGCINDTVLHLVNPHFPFGGVGASGMGAYHGKNSFLTFSHRKPVLHKAKFLDLWLRYPPFSAKKLKWLKRLFRLSSALD